MNRIYVDDKNPIVHDPTLEMIPFFKSVDPGFRIQSNRPGNGFINNFQYCKKMILSIDSDVIYSLGLDELYQYQSKALSFGHRADFDGISMLQLKKEISFRQMTECCLCAHRCKANRYKEKGRCGLDFKAYNSKPFIHIAEESVINPAIIVNFSNCSMDCVHCIAYEEKSIGSNKELNVNILWQQINELIEKHNPASLEFCGGNPTESLPWVFEVLMAAPSRFSLPIVLNSNIYFSPEALSLLNNSIDVYLVDFNFGNDECGKIVGGVEDYWDTARNAVEEISKQNSRMIFRILVLPEHLDCCHEPVLKFLSGYKEKVWVSVLDQYVPENRAYQHNDLNRRPTDDEILRVKKMARDLRLRDISVNADSFWK